MVGYVLDCEQSLSFPSVFLAFLRASVILMSSARGGFQEQKPTTRSLGMFKSVLASRSSGPGSSPDQGLCVLFLDKTHGVSLHIDNFFINFYLVVNLAMV